MPDEDDGCNFCVPGTDSLWIKINGCFFDDEDFDGQSYRERLAGDEPEREAGRQVSTRPRCCSRAR